MMNGDELSNRPGETAWRAFRETCLPGLPQGDVSPWPAFWQHDPSCEHDEQAWIDSTLRFYEETGTALVKLTGPAHYQVADRGVEGSWTGAPLGERTFTRRAIAAVADWQKIPAGLTSSEASVVRVAAALRRQLPAEVPLLVTVFAPATQALMLADPAQFMAHARIAPEAIRAALRQLAQQTATLIDCFAQAGVNGIFLVSKHHALMDRTRYLAIAEESDQLVAAACREFPANLLHLHGELLHLEGLPGAGPWMIHIEPDPRNPGMSQIRTLTGHPVILALDYPIWESGDVAGPIQQGLAALGQRSALVGAPCAVPLRYRRSEIATWVRNARSCHAG